MRQLTVDVNFRDAFEEGKHPRGEGGRFTGGATNAGRSTVATTRAALRHPNFHSVVSHPEAPGIAEIWHRKGGGAERVHVAPVEHVMAARKEPRAPRDPENEMVPTGTGRSIRRRDVPTVTRNVLGWNKGKSGNRRS